MVRQPPPGPVVGPGGDELVLFVGGPASEGQGTFGAALVEFGSLHGAETVVVADAFVLAGEGSLGGEGGCLRRGPGRWGRGPRTPHGESPPGPLARFRRGPSTS